MTTTTSLHHSTPVAVALALAATLVACGGGGTSATGGGVPIDPNRPGDLLFADGLTHYDAAAAAQAAAFAAQRAGDAAGAAAKFGEAVTEYGLARGLFDQLRLDPALCPGPAIRCDNAAYLGGRCSYEVGSIRNDQAEFEDARARLDAMLAAFPTSAQRHAAAYFDGRSRFQLAAGFGVGTYAEAEALFEAALLANPAGTYADNALYYDGRCEFELGIGLVTPLSPPAGSADFLQARTWFDDAEAALSQVPVRYPASSYRDNAAYYRGRALFEKPVDTSTAAGDAERVVNLDASEAALSPVVADAASVYRPGAHYWRGRVRYGRSFYATPHPTDLADALVDFHAVDPASTWRDNALYHAVKCQVRLGDCPGACADAAALVATFPGSTYTPQAAAYLATNLPSCTCP